MELTGKCKETFQKWLFDSFTLSDEIQLDSDSFKPYNIRTFLELPFSYQVGVYLDFFDSKNIFISIESVFDRMLGYNRGFQVQIYQDAKNPITLFNEYQDAFNTRNEAQIAAIEKANELYNNQP